MLMAESASVGVGLDLKFCISNQLLRTLAHKIRSKTLEITRSIENTPPYHSPYIHRAHFHSLNKKPTAFMLLHRRTHILWDCGSPTRESM